MEEFRRYYIVNFEGVGYYADKQPFYDFSFTEDALLAKMYSTDTNAMKTLTHVMDIAATRQYENDVLLKIKSVSIEPVDIKISKLFGAQTYHISRSEYLEKINLG